MRLHERMLRGKSVSDGPSSCVRQLLWVADSCGSLPVHQHGRCPEPARGCGTCCGTCNNRWGPRARSGMISRCPQITWRRSSSLFGGTSRARAQRVNLCGGQSGTISYITFETDVNQLRASKKIMKHHALHCGTTHTEGQLVLDCQ